MQLNTQSALLQEAELSHAELIPLDRIQPHPFNPRPQSDLYGWRVIDDKVEAIMHSISTHGYNQSEPILLWDQGKSDFICIKGHTRCVAMRELGATSIPAYTSEMTEQEAAIALVNLQGASVDPWSKRQHAYECCQSFGESTLMNISDYAEAINTQRTYVSLWLKEYEVALALMNAGVITAQKLRTDLSTNMASDIAKLQEKDWIWFTQLVLSKQWGKTARENAIAAILQLSNATFNPIHTKWIRMENWKQAAALEAGQTGASNALAVLQECVQKVEDALVHMDNNRAVWVFEKPNEPQLKHWDLPDLFITRLANLDSISPFQITQNENYLFAELQDLDADYQEFIAKHNEEQAAIRQAEAERQRLLILQSKYQPESVQELGGIPADVPLDIVFLNPASIGVPFNDEQVILDVTESLLPSGYLITFIPDAESLFAWHSSMEYSGCMTFKEMLVWIKPGSAHLTSMEDRFVNNLVFIHICTLNDSETPYFKPLPNIRHSISFSDVTEPEKLKWAENQIPLALANHLIELYAPADATIYDGATACGSIAAAAKSTKRKSYWYTNKNALYTRINERLENAPFHESIMLHN